ncbi:hypothetical protein A1O3_06221 [Capronia epimyces CBS 606.96]|uniref:Ornithine cyclodeaminase n=1 Tax=Capronia epimyces CBS 606.96 TaxID=1182542 RepID=W9XQD6_9EURO|nr:uncharacterized protein A1O3_06221 [Capronia epimyces CBS 606.96]EXJ82408.1 hypothetical protein A1O3_06221 [Capronia epimyces CBS 606.96]
MPLTVLTDAEVRRILLALTKEDAEGLQQNLAEALHSYSTGDTNSPCCSSFQPTRTAIKKNGVTTLFMPASTGTTVGMKIVSVEQPDVPAHSKQSSVSSAASSIHAATPSSTSGTSGLKSPISEFGNMTLTPASTTSVGSRESIDGASFEPPVSQASSQNTTPRGSVTILDATGNPVGIINAEELTAFRTALAATIMLKRRQHVHTITIFGAGRQAYWHIRLALLLKGDQIRHVNIINRTFARCIKLMKAFQISEESHEEWRREIKFSAMSPEFGEYGRLLKEEVRKADVIFCCTPSVEPLFPAEFLTSREGERKGRYISCIGSYAPHMCEIHPDVFKRAVEPHYGHRHHHKHAKQGGVIIVDNLESCLKEAGEVIKAKLKPEHLVEIGELMMIKKAATKELELGGPGEQGLVDWLSRGNVIYKSVGMGLMDLVVAGDLIRIARETNVGTTVVDF